MPVKKTEYMCSWCGKKVVRTQNQGRPEPGKCPRKEDNKPHTWTVNRKFES